MKQAPQAFLRMTGITFGLSRAYKFYNGRRREKLRGFAPPSIQPGQFAVYVGAY